MGSFISKSKVTNNDKVIFELKRQRDLLKKYQIQLHTNIENEKRLATHHIKEKDTNKAKQALKRKAFLTHLSHTTDGQLENLEKMTLTLENSVIQQQVTQRLSESNQALKKLNQEMSLEKMQLLLEETEEARLYQEEFNQQLKDFAGNTIDENELLNELEELQTEFIQAEMPSVPIEFPDVPQSEPSLPIKQEKDRAKEAPLEA